MSPGPALQVFFEVPAWQVERSGQRFRERHWRRLRDGRREDEAFADVIESGDTRYHWGSPGELEVGKVEEFRIVASYSALLRRRGRVPPMGIFFRRF